MLTVHHLNNSRSQRILWLLEELGLEYKIVRYERNKDTMLAPATLKAIHPLGKSPILTDGDFALAESGAIMEYVVARHGKGRLVPPDDSEAFWRYRYWMHYAEGSAMPPLLLKLVAQRIEKAPVPFFIRPIARKIGQSLQTQFVDPQLKLHFKYIADELEQTGWFAGETFSLADIQMSFPLEAGLARAGVSDHKPIVEFLQRIHSRPAYQRALEKGGPYSLLG